MPPMVFKLFAALLLAPAFIQCLDPAFNDDVLGLIVFKAGLADPEAKLATWTEDDDSPCNWVGVKCDPTSNRVSELVLDGFSLSGHIGRSLVRLQFLTVLSLSKNNLTGNINPILSQIQGLRILNLSENGLSGQIPDELFHQCGSLREISLAKNYLTGVIPDSISSCSALERVNFSSNQLSGQLPSGLWSLSSLRSLDLSENWLGGGISRGIESLYNLIELYLGRNSFVGELPQSIGNCVLIKSIDLSGNFFTGNLPQSMSKLTVCSSFKLRQNSFLGELPKWIGDMTTLEVLDLSANSFSGRIPDSIGNLQFLKEVNLSNNRFIGSLPGSILNCVNLKAIDASRNLLTGNLPPWTFKMGLESISFSGNKFSGSIEYPPFASFSASYQSLQVLDLSSNALTGEISSLIGNFCALKVLNLSRNYLAGPIPVNLGDLNTSKILDLSHNQLTGIIPSEIGMSVSLQELWLNRNFLIGAVPVEMENCSLLTALVLSENNLNGSIPAAIAKLTELQIVDLSYNNFSGSLPKELTNLSHLISFNVSHNRLEGELPVGGFFNTISPSSVSGNPSLCGSVLNDSCPSVHPKPLVLNPNSSDPNHGALSPNIGRKGIMLSISSLIAIGAAVFITLGVITVSILNLHVRSSTGNSATAHTFSGGEDFSHSHGTETNYGKLVMFSGEADFAAGTQALLNKDSELGRGGFGAVYRAELRDGHSVAIKKLNVSSLMKSQEDFEQEVKKIGKIRHQNLVSLEGYYWTPSLQLLINEYLCGGSLHKHLHDRQFSSCLTWQQRFNIIAGVGRGLAHLHKQDIIHYNIKSTNVLLDDAGEPRVADFGLARLLPMLDRYILSSKIQSALGYMAPEFACQTVKITEKCDVYAFGILTLEVVTGKRPVEYMEDDVIVLCDMVRGALEEGRVEDCIDKKLEGKFPLEEAIPVVKLGLICASQVPSNRPDMEEVIRILDLINCPSEGQEELE